MSEILTPKQVQECSDYYFVSPLARSHETLRAERDRLAAEVERLKAAPGARRCATCAWWGDGDDRRVDVHGIEIAPCHHPRSPVDEYPDGAFGCVLHEDR